MKGIYNVLIKPIIFLWSPEKAHRITLKALQLTLSVPGLSHLFIASMKAKSKKLEHNYWGLKFKNPVGLAAGFDKDGKYFRAMSALGFGYIEIGTVTPKPQEGNPQPRLFRLKKDKGLINRMGFNNEGVDALVGRLKKEANFISESGLIIGGNIGKNKLTPNENAFDDYAICFEKLFDHVHYFVVNVSSPNTPNLRDLQDKEPLTHLLNGLQNLNNKKDQPKPILLKIAPDLTDGQLDDIITIVADTKIQGIIATNTTISRDNLQLSNTEIESIGNGGLSGSPLKSRSTEVIKYLYTKSNNELFIIGVGGIETPQDALEKLDAGAKMVQVFSSMVYYGPTIVKDINNKIGEK